MSKYIDTDRLRAELKKRLKNVHDYLNGAGMKYKGPKYYKMQGKESAYDALLSIIISLQQEQPECSGNLVDVDAVREDFMTEVYRVLDADPTNDRANAIIGAFDSLPTVSQEQPEVIEGVVHHYANVHYLETNTEQSNARLKQFPEGAEVEIYIQRKEE